MSVLARGLPPPVSVLWLALTACGEPATAPPAAVPVAKLEVAAGDSQTVWSRRRSPEPFVVRAIAPDGRPAADALVRFQLEGVGGVLSQPLAVTDASGLAETYLMDATGRGAGKVVAHAGQATASFAVIVRRAPRRIDFLPATGAVALPGFPHPDSVLEVVVTDTEGDPLPGVLVWFAAPGEVSAYNDTTDARGHARTVLRRTPLAAGPNDVLAFILGFEPLGRTTRPTVAAAQRVLLVSIDGLRGDALARYGPPTLLRLAREGAWTDSGETVSPSLTVPAHLSLLAGVSPQRHGVFSERIRLTPEMADLEPLFRRAQRSGHSAAAFLSQVGPLAAFREALECRAAFGLDSVALAGSDGNTVAALAAGVLRGPDPHLVFVHIPDPDVAGHQYGWNSEEYGRAVLRADAAVALLVEALAAPDSTLVIVTSDHGGGGLYGPYLHGSDSPEDRLIPLILWGAHVRAGRLVTGTTILDVAPTALWALGMAPPPQYEGQALLYAFR